MRGNITTSTIGGRCTIDIIRGTCGNVVVYNSRADNSCKCNETNRKNDHFHDFNDFELLLLQLLSFINEVADG